MLLSGCDCQMMKTFVALRAPANLLLLTTWRMSNAPWAEGSSGLPVGYLSFEFDNERLDRLAGPCRDFFLSMVEKVPPMTKRIIVNRLAF